MLYKAWLEDFAQRFAVASVAGGCAAVVSCPVEVPQTAASLARSSAALHGCRRASVRGA